MKKIAAALVEPKLTIRDLEALSDEADSIIDLIFAEIDPKTAASIAEAKEKAENEDE